MKLVKSLLLGSAAGILAVAGASAADLPSKKGPAVEYVRICDAYGAGFFYIPGTETCLRISGYVRAEAAYLSSRNVYGPGGQTNPGNLQTPLNAAGLPNGTVGVGNSAKSQDQFGLRARARANFDARTQTAYGTLRSFARFDWTQDTGVYIQGVNTGTGAVDPTGRLNYFSVRYAFIQWAGFTAGSAQSFFDFYADALNFEMQRGSDTQTNLFAYTATFGGGFQATLSIEDRNRSISNGSGVIPSFTNGGANATGPGTTGGIAGVHYAGYRAPDVVGALRVDQPWGSAQLSGAAHQVNTIATNLIGSPSRSTYGYAVQAGVKFNLPFLAAGDEFWLQGSYAKGALNYIGVGTINQGNLNNGFLGRLLGGVQRTDADAIAFIRPGTVANANGTFNYSLEKESGYAFVAGLKHYWLPNFYQTVYGSYVRVNPGPVARSVNWNQGGLGRANEYSVGTTFDYTPVAGLDFGIDLLYFRLNQKFAGAVPTIGTNNSFASPLPVGVKRNASAYEARFRVIRSF